MRFGMMAAAAAVVLCAGQADAANWIKYEVSGTGSYTTYDTLSGKPPFQNSGDLRYTFVVDTDAPTGNVFGAAYSASVSTAGLSYSYQYTDVYSATSTGSVAAAFSNPTGAFPLASGRLPATGTLTATDANKGGFVRISGSITGINVLGPVAGFSVPTATAVPEPATWAMLIVGLAAIGYTARRRRVIETALA